MTITIKRMGARQQGLDSGRVRRVTAAPQDSFVEVGLVGHRDRNPAYARIEQSQVWVEVTVQPGGDEVVARLGLGSAGDGVGAYVPLDYGCRVLLEYPDGDPNSPVITARLHDGACRMPGSVAGLATGADGAAAPEVVVPAPQFHFIRTASGQLFALETGDGADILHHAGGSIELKADNPGAIHLDGTVHLGEGLTTPPVPGTVLPGNQQSPAVPGVPHVPTPITPVQNPLPAAQTNPADAIVRLKDPVLGNLTTDATFWGWVAAIAAFASAATSGATLPAANLAYTAAISTLGLPPGTGPTSMTSNHNTAGARHTASD